MNREIKFRGINKDTGAWVYGSHFAMEGEKEMRWYEFTDGKQELVKRMQKYDDYHYILRFDLPDCSGWSTRECIRPIHVIKESVGQFICEKYGQEIFEGDIFEGFFGEQNSSEDERERMIGKVRYNSGTYLIDFVIKNIEVKDMSFHKEYRWWEPGSLAGRDRYYIISGINKIGNIHDNPELLT